MTDAAFSVILSMVVPPAIKMIMDEFGMTEKEAITAFYNSKLYAALSQEELKAWHYGPAMLCDLFREERENGDFTWPEEAC